MLEATAVDNEFWRNIQMVIEAVLVSFTLKGSRTYEKASGVLFNNNFVFVTGAVLIPLLSLPEHRQWLVSLVKSSSSKFENNKEIENISFKVFREIIPNKTNDLTEVEFLPLETKVFRIWKCSLVSHSLENLFYDWTLGHVNKNYSGDQSQNSISADIDMSKELISIFIILKCAAKQEGNTKEEKLGDDIKALSNLLLSLKEPVRGQEVEIISTPFGSSLCLNSLSRGIISNVIGKEKCLILTDARTVSGCEGGPIFIAKSSRDEKLGESNFIGLVTCPLAWSRGEWVGLTIGINFSPVLKSLLQTLVDPVNLTQSFTLNSSSYSQDSLSVKFIDETVILIRCDSFWGSGVILDASSGVIITCSHIIKKMENVNVYYKKQHYSASVIFKTPDGLAYDLAVLKVKGVSIFKKAIQFSNKNAKVGDKVITVGFPFFSEQDIFDLSPSLVQGYISKSNRFMIQTTCCIQSGFSGGAILKDGKLLGINVCNAKDSTAGALFPHINFAIPISVFQNPVMQYMKTNNPQCLKVLESEDPKIQSLWALQSSKL